MDASVVRGPREWALALAARPLAARHYLIVFLPVGAVSVAAEAASAPALLGHWSAAVAAATVAGLVGYLVAGRLVGLIRPAPWRGALVPLVGAAAGLIRGIALIAFAHESAPVDDPRASTRLLWNLLAGAILVTAVAIADRELSDVIALQSSVGHRRRERRRLELAVDLDGVLSRWTAALRDQIGRSIERLDREGAPASTEEHARRLLDDLERRLAREALAAAEEVVPTRFTLPSPHDRRALFELTAGALHRARVPLAAVMALCVGIFHDARVVDAVSAATFLSGVILAAATTVALVPLLAGACRLLPDRTPPTLRGAVISLGLVAVGGAAALVDLQLDSMVVTRGDIDDAVFAITRAMVAALVAGWAWMVIAGLSPYAEALREENARESRMIVRLVATQLRVFERAEEILHERLRARVRPVVEEVMASLAAGSEPDGGCSAATRERLVEALSAESSEYPRRAT